MGEAGLKISSLGQRYGSERSFGARFCRGSLMFGPELRVKNVARPPMQAFSRESRPVSRTSDV